MLLGFLSSRDRSMFTVPAYCSSGLFGRFGWRRSFVYFAPSRTILIQSASEGRSHGLRSNRCPRLRFGLVWRRSFQTVGGIIAAVAFLVTLPVGTVQAEDWSRVNRETAKSQAMYAIAVTQAQAGDYVAAKRTVSQIGEGHDVVASDVVGVCCMDCQIFYDHPPGSYRYPMPAPSSIGFSSPGWGGYDWQGNQYFLNRDRPRDHVPPEVPARLAAGLPRSRSASRGGCGFLR